MDKKNKFKWRGATTFILTFSTLISAVSGIILYFTPSGRIARNTDWSILGMDKWGWKDLHIVFSLILLIIIAFHLYFNWRMIFHFFWSKIRASVNLKKELIISGLVILVVFLGTFYRIEPFKSITETNQYFKHRNGHIKADSGWYRFQNRYETSGFENNNVNKIHRRSDYQQRFGRRRGRK
jgi:hypothetical protein